MPSKVKQKTKHEHSDNMNTVTWEYALKSRRQDNAKEILYEHLRVAV